MHFFEEGCSGRFDTKFRSYFENIIALNMVEIDTGQRMNMTQIDAFCIDDKRVVFDSDVHLWYMSRAFDGGV